MINGTSIGLYDAEARLPLDTKTLKPGQIVANVVFSPPVTRLLREAAVRGCKILDGLSMLVNQGVLGVQYWTGVLPDAAMMQQALALATRTPTRESSHYSETCARARSATFSEARRK